MSGGPELHYHLPCRTAGSFGASTPGRVAESLTLTWFRFEVFLIWLALVPVIVASPAGSFTTRTLLALVSPLAAVAIWVLFKLTGWVLYLVPGLGKLWGWGRIAFLWAFSRLIVQPAPTIDIPAWSHSG